MNLDELKPAQKHKQELELVVALVQVLEKLLEEDIKDKKQEVVEELEEAFEGGQTPLYRRLPKRGFTNIFANNYTEVTLTMLNKSSKEDVTAESFN